MTNHLYYGDNLAVLRDHIGDETVDLIYLDPPFNSNASYNVLFKGPRGNESPAQIEAFDDTWVWNDLTSGKALAEVKDSPYQDAAAMLDAMVGFLGKNAMTAYLCMMGVRLTELHRVLKPTGSLYLHCDPTASHYLKVLLDAVFGARCFRNEIVWHRRLGMSSAVHSSNRFGTETDTIFYFAKTDQAGFNPQYNKESYEYQRYIRSRFTLKDENGRLYQATSLVNPAPRPNLKYEYKGYQPPSNGWMISREKMEQWDQEGRLHFPKDKNKRIRRKSFADELKGMPIQSLWDDIPALNSRAQERLGYPTQKPVALLERILAASSNEGDLVLDPFCGCGTTVHAAQKLNRAWIGIDVTHLAISLIETRLKDAFGDSAKFEVHGTPKDVAAARDFFDRDDRTKKEFEKWACGLVAAYPQNSGRKGADGGIDGTFWFGPGKKMKAIVSVKGGKNVGVAMIRELDAVVTREKADLGVFLTLEEPTKPMVAEAKGMGTLDVEGFSPRPRIQIVTIEAALSRGPAAIDAPLRHGDTYKAAPVEKDTSAQGKLDL